jgi:hypothetical protein
VKRSLCSLVVLLSLAAGSCLAADAAQTSEPQKKDGFDPNQIICKRVDVTDSHLGGQRVCATWAQWDQQAQQDQEAMRQAVGRAGQSGVAGGFGPSGAGAGGMGGMHH